MIKRSRIELYLDILTIVDKGECKPTKIMYHTNMSWKPMWKFINRLVAEGLLTVNKNAKNKRIIELTERGHEILKVLSSINMLLH